MDWTIIATCLTALATLAMAIFSVCLWVSQRVSNKTLRLQYEFQEKVNQQRIIEGRLAEIDEVTSRRTYMLAELLAGKIG